MVVNPVNHVLGGQYTSAVTEGELPHKKTAPGSGPCLGENPLLKPRREVVPMQTTFSGAAPPSSGIPS
jgi:hypothetical protein